MSISLIFLANHKYSKQTVTINSSYGLYLGKKSHAPFIYLITIHDRLYTKDSSTLEGQKWVGRKSEPLNLHSVNTPEKSRIKNDSQIISVSLFQVTK